MREFHWCDFDWDPATFPDPEGMLAPAEGERACGSASGSTRTSRSARALFEEGRAKRLPGDAAPDGSVWQWDKWQAGMALVDFTNPAARAVVRRPSCERAARPGRRLLQDRLRRAHPDRRRLARRLRPGADAQLLHAPLQPDRLRRCWTSERGEGEAVLFARSATAGGQQFPVHWGGDCESTFDVDGRVAARRAVAGRRPASATGATTSAASRAPRTPAVFKRWLAFGLLSVAQPAARLRLLPGAVGVRRGGRATSLRQFTRLKLSLMPYLAGAAARGAPRRACR